MQLCLWQLWLFREKISEDVRREERGTRTVKQGQGERGKERRESESERKSEGTAWVGGSQKAMHYHRHHRTKQHSKTPD